MDMGGRLFVYNLMGMDPPPVAPRPRVKSAPKLEIDRTGSTDPARYSGLKMGQVLDDDVMAEALQQAQERRKKGEDLRPKLLEEEFERPFAGTFTGSVVGVGDLSYYIIVSSLCRRSH